jgi:hypothetical protein
LDDKALKKYRRETYPAFVAKVAEIIGTPPYYLMPLWSESEQSVTNQDKDGLLGNLTKYIKIAKMFRDSLIQKGLVSAEKIERYFNATDKSAQDTQGV